MLKAVAGMHPSPSMRFAFLLVLGRPVHCCYTDSRNAATVGRRFVKAQNVVNFAALNNTLAGLGECLTSYLIVVDVACM